VIVGIKLDNYLLRFRYDYHIFSLLTDKILKVPKHFLYTTYSVSYTLAFPSLKNLPLIKIRTTVRLSDSYSGLKYV